jgi:hypothetical protein
MLVVLLDSSVLLGSGALSESMLLMCGASCSSCTTVSIDTAAASAIAATVRQYRLLAVYAEQLRKAMYNCQLSHAALAAAAAVAHDSNKQCMQGCRYEQRAL